MKVYEKITNDLGLFIKLVDELNLESSCKLCKEYGLFECCDDNCSQSLKEILQMDYVESKKDNEDFDSLIYSLNYIRDQIKGLKMYTEINNAIDILNKDIKLSYPQRNLLKDKIIDIKDYINQINTLNETLDEFLDKKF